MSDRDSLAGRTVLVVEDDYVIAADIADTLRDAGAQVVGPVPSVSAALLLVRAAAVLDGAFLDVNLQGEMAFPVADALSARDVPFVFATGYDMELIPRRYAHVLRCEKPLDVVATASRMLSGRSFTGTA